MFSQFVSNIKHNFTTSMTSKYGYDKKLKKDNFKYRYVVVI